jgi:hypothetical protein
MNEAAPTDATSRPQEPVLLALEKAAQQAAAQDAEGAIRTILDSGYPNRLVKGRVLADRYSRVSRDVRAEAVAEGLAALHTAITKETPVRHPGGYVLKVADRICAQEQRMQEQQASSDGLLDRETSWMPGPPGPITKIPLSTPNDAAQLCGWHGACCRA